MVTPSRHHKVWKLRHVPTCSRSLCKILSIVIISPPRDQRSGKGHWWRLCRRQTRTTWPSSHTICPRFWTKTACTGKAHAIGFLCYVCNRWCPSVSPNCSSVVCYPPPPSISLSAAMSMCVVKPQWNKKRRYFSWSVTGCCCDVLLMVAFYCTFVVLFYMYCCFEPLPGWNTAALGTNGNPNS